MCGIIGCVNDPLAKLKTAIGLKSISNRGKDTFGSITQENLSIAHVLHSVVGHIKQPLKKEGILSSNCEIYNWKELCEKHKIQARNDSELILKLLDNQKKIDFKVLDEFDGVWAFVYYKENKLILSRDILGVKPLWYGFTEKGFCFASEKKALNEMGCERITFLDPRKILIYNSKTRKISFKERSFFKIIKKNTKLDESVQELMQILDNSVKKRIPYIEFGLLFSGGIDSVILALLLKKLKKKFICYIAYVKEIGESKDLVYAKKIAKEHNLKLKTVAVSKKQVEKTIPEIVNLIESSNPIKVGVALPIYFASKKAKEDKLKVILSGLGADEIFAGYSRFKESNNITLDSKNLLLQMHENDLYRDDIITMENNIELRLPYLDHDVIRFSLGLKDSFKINSKENKIILREVGRILGLKEEYYKRKKMAAQYGSGFDKTIEKLAKENKFKTKSEYLKSFAKQENLNLGCLFSGGKDSNLALWIMQRQNYKISCLISILPDNPNSYMYQKPDLKFLKLQSKALEIPLITKNTKGEKEKELKELKLAIQEAKKKYNIQGIVSGALFSNYQRERIQNICNDLGLRLFSPLWHKKQDSELQELLDNNFQVLIVKIAGYGLSEKWLGKILTKKDLQELKILNKKYGFNVAGEGGEYESLILSAPTFKKNIKILKYKKILENEFTGYLEINKITLE